MRGARRFVLIALLDAGLFVGVAVFATAQPPEAQPSAVLMTGPQSAALSILRSGAAEHVQGLGWAVALSGDGSTYLVSRPYIRVNAAPQVVVSIGSTWLFEQGRKGSSATFADTSAVDQLFGFGSAISADGKVVVIGSPGTKTGDAGYLYCYTKGAKGWQAEKTYPTTIGIPGGRGDAWGFSVALSGNGSTILVGAPGRQGHGSAAFFVAPPKGWSSMKQGDPLVWGYLGSGLPQKGEEFGRSVAISADGSVVAVGAPGADSGRGRVYLFLEPSGGWTAAETYYPVELPNGKAGDRFGESVALSADGTTLAVGADRANGGLGGVFIVRMDKAKMTLDLHGLANGGKAAELGISVALSADGRTLATGAMGNATDDGEVLVYRSAAGDWSDPELLKEYRGSSGNPDVAHALFGMSVALDGPGSVLLVGAPGYQGGAGTYFLFDLAAK